MNFLSPPIYSPPTLQNYKRKKYPYQIYEYIE